MVALQLAAEGHGPGRAYPGSSLAVDPKGRAVMIGARHKQASRDIVQR